MLRLGSVLRSFTLLLLLRAGLLAQTASTTLPHGPEPAETEYRIERVGGTAGLPAGVRAMVEDLDGYLWLAPASNDGLLRYDGYEVVRFSHLPRDTTSLGSDRVEALFVDRSGSLWIGTAGGGLNRFDARTETFSRLRRRAGDTRSLSQDTVTAIAEDLSGRIWAGTPRGLNRIDPRSGEVTRYLHNSSDPRSLSCDAIRVLYVDRAGTLWAGAGMSRRCGGGLNRFDAGTETFDRFVHQPGDPTSLLSNEIHALLEDADGAFWVGTGRYGLHEMDRERGSFERLRTSGGQPASLTLPYATLPSGVLETARTGACDGRDCGRVSFIHESEDGILWIGDTPGGVSRFATQTLTTSVLPFSETRPSALAVTRDGSVWLGAPRSLLKITRDTGSFRRLPAFTGTATALMQDPTDSTVVWIGTAAGEVIRSTPSDTRRFRPADVAAPSGAVYALAQAPDGTLRVGNAEGLSSLDPASGSWTPIFLQTESADTLRGEVRVLLTASDGVLWLGTAAGLVRYLPDADIATLFVLSENSPGDNAIAALHLDSRGRLWVGTVAGALHVFDPRRERFRSQIPARGILSVLEDGQGRLWAAGARGRLLLVDPKLDRASEPFDLPERGLSALLVDATGRLWIAQRTLLVRLDPDTGAMQSYGQEDGLDAGEFVAGAALRRSNGEVLFAMENGIVAFDPGDFAANPVAPIVHITRLSGAQDAIEPARAEVDVEGDRTYDDVTLPHDENDITFEFIGLHYADPTHNRYRYKLEPFDREWYDAGTQRSARYSRLPPGRYVFRVQAANRDGRWSDHGAAIAVTIRPPWWSSNLALFLYGVLLVGLIAAIERTHRQRLASRERERARQRELELTRERDQAADRLRATQRLLKERESLASLGELTAGLAPRLGAPLESVTRSADGAVEELTRLIDGLRDTDAPEGPKAEDLEKRLEEIKEKSAAIARDGRQVDEWVRALARHAVPAEPLREPTDINALVEENLQLALTRRQSRDPRFSPELIRDFSPETATANVAPAELGQVIVNLIENAFDAVARRLEEGGESYVPRIEIATARTEDQVEIRIRDNGPGIPRSIRGKLFEPFFSTKEDGAGAGLGLSVCHDLIVGKYGGSIDLEIPEEGGAEFVVRFGV